MLPSLLPFAAALTLLVAAGTARLDAQTDHERHHPRAKNDSAFRSMQRRGTGVMGTDLDIAVHRFEAGADGGRIELQRADADAVEVDAIRTHLREISVAFAAGNFAIPGFVHDSDVPGVDVMRARKDRIRYEFRPLAKGGEVRIVTRDGAAREAIGRFIEFQRIEHRTESHR